MTAWGSPAPPAAAPIKPSGLWYIVGGTLLVVVGLIAPAVLGAYAFFGVITALEDFDRVPADTGGTITLESGPQTLYAAGSGVDRSTVLTTDSVRVTGPDGDTEVLSRAAGDENPLALGTDVYLPQLSFVASEPGAYEIRPVEGAGTPPEVEDLVVGDSLEQMVEDRVLWFLAAGLIALVGGGAGLVILILTGVRRGRAKRQRGAGPGPAAGGPPQGWEGQPQWGGQPSWGPPPPVSPQPAPPQSDQPSGSPSGA
jgi:hypothetical protein